jgi:membrane fusion protein (multidrug efflux system)
MVCLAILLVLGSACGKFGKPKEKETSAKETSIPVELTILGRGAIESVLEASSSLEAEREVKVVARTANRVETLRVEEGDEVVLDDLLVQLQNDIQILQVSKASNQVEEAKEEFERQASLHQQNLVSDQAFSQTKYQLQQLQLNLEDAQRELGYTLIKAPIGGKVTQRMVRVGDQVTAGQHLFTVIDFSSIVARLFIPEKELKRVAVNQRVRVRSTAFPEQVFEGYVLRIAPVVESASGMIKVTVGFQDVGPLLPGMYVDADIVTASQNQTLLMPKKAIVYDGEQRFVFRLKPDNTVERILLSIGLEDADHVEPVALLKEGDRIVVAGQTGLKDGSQVKALDVDASQDQNTTSGEVSSSDQPTQS